MRELLIATKNIGKYKEIVEALDGLDFRFIFLKDFIEDRGIDDSDFVEDGETFADNARKKAEYYFEKSGMLTLGEDSGILVEALKGELGVKTRRWGAGESASDEQWIEYFLERMSGEKDRGAEFVCWACLCGEREGLNGGVGEEAVGGAGKESVVNGDVFSELFEGKTVGFITEELQASLSPGIPLSSCFMPEGADKVYSALSVEEKNRISHRGKAMVGVREWLEGR